MRRYSGRDRRLGIGTVIIIGLISWYFGIDPSVLLNGAQILAGGTPTQQQAGPSPPVVAGMPTDPTGKFVALVLGDTEDRWKEIFAANGRTYHPPRLRLFKDVEQTPCAYAQSAMGPFYCPRDQRIYLDISFFDDLQIQVRRLRQQQRLQIFRGLCDRSRSRPPRAGRARHCCRG